MLLNLEHLHDFVAEEVDDPDCNLTGSWERFSDGNYKWATVRLSAARQWFESRPVGSDFEPE